MGQQRQGLPLWLLAAAFPSGNSVLYDDPKPPKIKGEDEDELESGFQEQ